MIRQATEDDIEGIARVAVESWRWAFSSFLPSEFIEERCNLERRIENLRRNWGQASPMMVADEAGIVGFVSEYWPPSLPNFDAEIGALYVAPRAAGRGIGYALVRTSVRMFLQRECRSMAIHTLKGNWIGRNFYEKIGGRIEATDLWNGFPCVWYGWDEARLNRIEKS